MTNENERNSTSPLRTPILHVTAHNCNGQGTVHSCKNGALVPYRGIGASRKRAYTTANFPADLKVEQDIEQRQGVVCPVSTKLANKVGAGCRFVDFALLNELMMHRTQSLHFSLCLSSRIIMKFDDGSETILSAGAIAVLWAIMHSWGIAREIDLARMLYVLQDCQPLRIGEEKLQEDLEVGDSILPETSKDGV